MNTHETYEYRKHAIHVYFMIRATHIELHGLNTVKDGLAAEKLWKTLSSYQKLSLLEGVLSGELDRPTLYELIRDGAQLADECKERTAERR